MDYLKRFLVPVVSLVAALVPIAQAKCDEQAEFDGSAVRIKELLASYCLDCHSAEDPEGEREFESFVLPIEDVNGLITADEIIDQITLKTMPPLDAEQPSPAERLEMLKLLRDEAANSKGRFSSTGGRTIMRRLSSREYENTLESLFDRRVDTLGLTAEFPKENTSEHIDTIGASLVTSGFLLDQYFAAADRLVELRLGKPEMEPQDWHFTDHFVQYEELNGPHRTVFNFDYLCLYEQPNTDTRQGGYGHIEDFLGGVPASGIYDIEVLAQAMHRDTHYDPKIFRIDFSEPFQLAVVPGDASKGHIHYPQAIEPVLDDAIVPDEKPEWIKFRVWLEAGQTPRFIFPNGPYESRASVIEVNKRYADEFKNPKVGVSRTSLLREGALPHIRIDEIKIRGPVEEPGGSKEEIAVFGKGGFVEERAPLQLLDFARRAFRRPLSSEDKERITNFYQRRLSDSVPPRQAALDSIKYILCSPAFIYLSEITPEQQTKLEPFDLASRLSYALWCCPPDDHLFNLADNKQLLEERELRKEVTRLLADERSNEFVRSFLDSWLNLRDIGNLPPPRKSATEYYSQNLPVSMKEEAYQFFVNLLQTNGPVTDFLNSDYTFVDKKLAKLYGLPEKDSLRLADGFQRVSLSGNKRRGGVLGMAGVLTVSANGVDTSPVTRGVWVLENILGTTPPPPPDEVPALESNTKGAKTIREQLALHSQDETCNVCHRKIDPLGFALESFDPIGRWRSKYPKAGGKAAPIDTTGEFPSGETYSNFAEFREVLAANRSEIFTRSLIKKLLAYSCGRHMEPSDRYVIEDILAKVKEDNYGLRTLVIESLSSPIFRSR